MSSRPSTLINFLLILSLLFNLFPAPRMAQARPASLPVVERPAVPSPTAGIWLPPVRPVDNALASTTRSAAPAVALPDWFAAPEKAALAPPTRATRAPQAAPWPPAGYSAFVWAATDNAGAWYWDEVNGWQQRSGGELGSDAQVNDVAVSPFDHERVLAATDDGIYITTTAQSWVSVTLSSNISDARWSALRWDTHRPGVVFATGSRGGPQGYKIKPVWARSTDHGTTWTGGELYEGDGMWWEMYVKGGSDVWGAGDVWYIVSSQNGGRGVYYKRFWRSLDGGQTWQAHVIDIADTSWVNVEKWVAGRLDEPARVYVAPYVTPYQEDLAHSEDGGESWHEDAVPGDEVRHLEYDRTRPNTLWAACDDGVIRSSDDGASFSTAYTSTNTLCGLAIDGYTGRVYAGGGTGGINEDFVYWDGTSWNEPGGMPSPADGNTTILALSAPQPPYLAGWMVWNPECPFCTAHEAANHGGDPVNTRDGSFTHNQPGFALPVLGGSLDFRLTYVSQATEIYTTTLGYGWTHNQAVRLSFPYGSSGPVELQGHGGSRLVFGNHGNGTYSPFPGLRAELTRLGTAGAYTYVVTATTQAVYTFDYGGQLLTIQDSQGNVTTFEHQGGQLSRVIGPSSDPDQQRVLDFSYDGQDRLIQVTGLLSGSAALSYTVGIAYDGNGDLATFTDTRGLAWSYTYAGSSHLLTRVTDPNGNSVMENTYDGRGRVTQQKDPLGNALHFGYTLSNTTLLTDALGRATVDAYDGRGTWAGSVYTSGETITRGYDGNFNLGLSADALGHETAYDWSDGGYDLEKVTDAAGQATGFDYDARHNLIRSVNARGYATTYTYDAQDNLTAITDTLGGVVANTYDAYGNLLSTTDQRGASTSYAYDAFGQRTVITDALGLVTRFEYDALGRLITSTDHASTGRITLHAYDLSDHLIRTTHNYTSATTTQNYQGLWNLVTAYAYDAAGNRTLITNTQYLITKYAYDAANRLVSTTQNYTSAGGIDYQATYNLVTRYGYDAVGNQTVVTDTAPAFADLITGSRVTRTFFDNLDRPIETVLNYADGVYDPQRPDEDVATSYGYDAAGNLITTTDTLGRVTLNTYDTLNRLVKTTLNYTTTRPNPDPTTYNLVTTYAYDPVGNVVTTTNSELRIANDEYDALNRLIKTTANYTTAGGQNYLNQYNLVTEYGYDAAGNRIQITNSEGRIAKYEYDALGRLVTTTANYTSTPGADPNTYNLLTTYQYDERGNRTRIANGELPLRVTNYEYDVLDRLVEMEDAEGSVTSYAYDVLGNVTQITNPQSLITNYQYDALSRLLTTTDALSGTTVAAYDPYDNPIRHTDARGGIVGVEYDRLERPLRQVSLEGLDGALLAQDTFEDASAWTVVTGTWTVENGTYRQSNQGSANSDGMVSLFSGLTVTDFVALVDLKFEATNQPYAVAGLVFRRSADGDESTMVGVRLANAGEWQSGLWSNPDGGLGEPYSTTYRIQGGTSLYVEAGTWHRVGVVARGETVILLLDGAPVSSWDGDPRESGNVGLITFHSDVRFDNFEVRSLDGYQETVFEYDGLGNKVQAGKFASEQDGSYAIRNTQYAYDSLNRLVAVTDPLSHTTQYAYDALGNRTVMTDAGGIATRYEYDALSRLSAVVENHQTSQPTNAQTNVRTEYSYDALGQRTAVTDALGHTTVYTYDTLGRLVAERDPLGQRTHYAYDALSQRTAMTQALGTAEQTVIGYEYDDVGRLLEITYSDPSAGSGQAVTYQYDAVGNRTAMTDTLGSTTYSYDALNRLTQVSDPYGEVVGYTYDALGRRTGLVYPSGEPVTYTYDALNRLTQLADWDGGATLYGYDEAGRLVTATLPNGARTAYAYDDAERLTQIEHRNATDALLARYAYALDEVGNRVQATETLSVPAQGLVTTTITYTYDSLYRLTEADYSSGENFQYQYDATGNRTAYTATVGGTQVTTYSYDAANRLVKVDDVAYTWNALGQLTRDGTYTYTWDAAGRLITVTDGITTLGFLYDGDGNRLARVVNGTLTTHTLDVGLGLPEVLVEHGSGTTRYLHLPTGIATDDGAWTYSAADGLGSVRQRLGASGQVVAVNDYRPFGSPLAGEGGSPYGFTGEWWEGDAGLLFLRARYYDPATGRFLSQDPFPGYAAAPGTLHPYLYGHNNPAMFVDPSGNFGLLGAAVGALGGGLVGGLVGGVSYALTTDDFSLGGLLGSAGKGAVTGAAAGAVVGAFGPVAAPTLLGAVSQSAAIGATSSAVGAGVGYALDTLPNGQFGLGGLFTSMGLGGLSGLVGGGIGGAFGWSTNALLGKLMPHLGLTALPNWAGWTVAVGGGTLGGGIGGVATQAALNVLSCHDDSLWEAFQWGAFGGGVGGGFGYWAQLRSGNGSGGGVRSEWWDDETPRRPGLPQRTPEGTWRKGQLTNREFKGLRRLAKRWNQRIVLSGSLSETDLGLQRRYDPNYRGELPKFRRNKWWSDLIDTGVSDVDLWEGSNLTQAQLGEISELFYGWETDMGYELKYYETIESFADQGGALVFEPSGKVWRVPAPWQLPEWP